MNKIVITIEKTDGKWNLSVVADNSVVATVFGIDLSETYNFLQPALNTLTMREMFPRVPGGLRAVPTAVPTPFDDAPIPTDYKD